jgi:hypothetical protein
MQPSELIGKPTLVCLWCASVGTYLQGIAMHFPHRLFRATRSQRAIGRQHKSTHSFGLLHTAVYFFMYN